MCLCLTGLAIRMDVQYFVVRTSEPVRLLVEMLNFLDFNMVMVTPA